VATFPKIASGQGKSKKILFKMKKILTIFAALILAANADAQVRFGIKTGLNLSQESSGSVKVYGMTTDVAASDILPGAHLGMYSNFGFNKHLGLQVEALFSMQGGSESEGATTVNEYLSYINIPILLDIKPIPELSIFVGPQVGINVYNYMTMGEETLSGSDVDDILSYAGFKINPVDFAAVVGVQGTFIDHLTAGIRYNIGLTPVLAAEDGDISISGGANRVLQLSIGWTF
jgi:hypothetical protein